MKESLHTLDKDCIFRETFNSEYDVRRNGGEPVNMIFSEGKAICDGTAYLTNSKFLSNRVYSVRIKINVPDFSLHRYLFDFRTGTGLGSAFLRQTTGEVTSGGTEYINGVLNNIAEVNKNLDIVLSGITLYTETFLNLLRNYSGTQLFKGTIELFEIYNKALTAEEVANLYNNVAYKDIRDGLVVDVDARRGLVQDNMGNNITNAGAEIVRHGNIYVTKHSTTTTKLSIPISLTTKYSQSLWVKTVDYQNNTAGYITNVGGGTYINSMRIWVYNNGDIASWNQNDLPILKDLAAMNNTRWFHIATTFDNTINEHKLYVDGKLKDSGAAIRTLDNTSIDYAASLSGLLSQLRVYNRVLSAAEIAQLYTSQKGQYNE